MIRIATTADVPEMLAIYTPYVENTTVSFEYVPPTLEEFTNRFATYTRQFPWLVWEEGGVLLGYAYASAPFSRAAYGWCAEPTVYLRPEAGDGASPTPSMPRWRTFSSGRAIRCSTPWSAGKICPPGGFTKSRATVSLWNFPILALKWAAGSAWFGMKNVKKW